MEFPIVLSLEWIGNNADYERKYMLAWDWMRLYRRYDVAKSHKPWVACLYIKQGKMQRDFLQGRKDYSQANASGSRGIYLRFVLYPGKIYEVFSAISCTRTERFYARVSNRSIERIDTHEVIACLKNQLA